MEEDKKKKRKKENILGRKRAKNKESRFIS